MHDLSTKRNQSLKKVIIILLITMLILVLGFHVLLPLLGIAIVISVGLWTVAIAAVTTLCVAGLLFFIFSGVGVIITAIVAFVLAFLAIILFPILLPILLPLLLLIAIIFIVRRKQKSALPPD